MKTKVTVLGILLVLTLVLSVSMVAPAMAATSKTLNVANWASPADLNNVSGRPVVIKVDETYHMWYATNDYTLYHISSADPSSFGAGTLTTYTGGAPAEVGSVTTVLYDGSTFSMIAYETIENGGIKKFALYTSTDGTAWTYSRTAFDGTGLTDYQKVDAPHLFLDGATYKLYFQVKTPETSPTAYNIYTAESDSLASGFALANSDNPVLSPGAPTEWDGAYVMHPMVVKDNGVYYMWYSAHNGVSPQQIGFASSTDGYNWTKSPGNPVISRADFNAIGEPSVINDQGAWRMWYLATNNAIRYMTATGPFEFSSIQAAINAANDDDTINVAVGTYTLTSTLNLTKANLKISGNSESGVIIDASGVGGYGIAPAADGITLERFTLIGPAGNLSGRYGIKASHMNDLTIRNVTVKASGKSEFDLNDIDGGLLENITANGQNTNGVGVALSNTNDITLRNITTTGNIWGGVGLYDYSTGPTTNVVFEGTHSISEDIPIYIDAEYGFGVSNVDLPPGYTYAVMNTEYRESEGSGRSDDFIIFKPSKESAISFALSLQTTPFPANTASYIQTVVEAGVLDNNFIVGAGMSIQSAISAASDGDTINVEAGTFTEQITMNIPLNLIGVPAGEILPVIKGTLTINHGGVAQTVDTNIENLSFVVDAGDSIAMSGADNVKITDCRFDGNAKWIISPNNGYRAVQMNSPASSDITIDTCYFSNGYYGCIQGYATNVTVIDSVIENVKSGINHQGGNNLMVTNTNISVVAQGVNYDTYCVRFASNSGTSNGATITGGSLSVDKNDYVAAEGYYHKAIVIRAAATGALKINGTSINGEILNESATSLDATKNWWGSAEKPIAKVSSGVKYDPWYTNGIPSELASDKPVYNKTQKIGYDTIQEAIYDAASGDEITVDPGIYKVDSTIIVDESVTISGPTIGDEPAVVIGQNGATVPVFQITVNDVSIKNLDISLTADAISAYGVKYDGLVQVGIKGQIEYLTGIQILNNRIFVPVQGTRDTMSTWGAFGIRFERGCTGTITGNTIYNTRQGISGNYGSAMAIEENTIYNTKGGVCIYTNLGDINNHTVANNLWTAPDSALSHSEWDIVWHSGGTFSAVTDWDSHYQTYVLDLSAANNNGYVTDWRHAGGGKATQNNRSHVFVDDNGVDNAEGGLTTPMNSIQTAITGVVPSGQVIVAAGEYEGNIHITKSLIITGDPGNESAGPGVNAPVIDGQNLPDSGFFIEDGVMDVIIQGFEIKSFRSSDNPDDNGVGNGVQAWVASTSNITIRDNYFHDLEWNGVLVGNDGALGDHTHWTITNNILEDYDGYGLELTNASDSTISDNIIHASNSWTGIMTVARRSESKITISGNIIDGTLDTANKGARAAIFALGWGKEVGDVVFNDISITGNTISITSTENLPYIRVYKYGGVGDAAVTGVSVTGNNLAGATGYAVRNDTGVIVNASKNWWGTNVRAEIKSKVSGKVVYAPWYTTEAMTEGDISSSGMPVTNKTKGTSYDSIQEAIDDADVGDEIVLETGTFSLSDMGGPAYEPVSISQPLTLKGAGSANTILDAGYPDGVHCDVIWIHSSNVNLEGLTVKNGNFGIRINGPDTTPLTAIKFTDVVVTGNTASGFVFDNYVAAQTVNNITFINCRSDNNGNRGIYFVPGKVSNTVTLTNTSANNNKIIGFDNQGTMTGLKITGGTFNNNTGGSPQGTSEGPYYGFGIQLQNVTGAELENVTAQSNGTGGPQVYEGAYGIEGGAGIVIKNSTATIKGATLQNNANGLWVEDPWVKENSGAAADTLSITGSNILNNLGDGVANYTADSQVNAGKNWWGSANGPVHTDNTYNVGSQGAEITGNVNFAPWLNSGTDTDLSTPGFQPAAGTSFAPITNSEAESYASIQSAVTNTTPGGTVNVKAGTFTETVTITNTVTLKGAQAGIDARSRTGVESIITSDTQNGTIQVKGPASSGVVTIDGFRIVNTSKAVRGNGIHVNGETNNVNVRNNIVSAEFFDDPDGKGKYGGNGINFWMAKNAVAEYNYVLQAGTSGITAGHDNTETYPAGIKTKATIQYNKVRNSNFGITGYHSGSTIENNEVWWTNDALTLANHSRGGGIGGQMIDTVIQNNTVYGYTKGAGLLFTCYDKRACPSDTTAVNNTVYGNLIGVLFDQESLTDMTVEKNAIYNNTQYHLAIVKDVYVVDMEVYTPDPAFTAVNNFWGTANVAANMFTPGVTYDPWHLKNAPTPPVTVADEKISTTSVRINWTASDIWIGDDYYDFRYSEKDIVNNADWNAAKRISNTPTPKNGAQEMIVTGLKPDTTYYFAFAVGYKNPVSGFSAVSGFERSEAIKTKSDKVADTTPPLAVTALAAAAGSPSTTRINLTWTAPEDNEYVKAYIIKRYTSAITDANWNNATLIVNSIKPGAPGQTEAFTVTGLTPGVTYHFAVKAKDTAGNESAIGAGSAANASTAALLPQVASINPVSADNGESRTITVTGSNFNAGTTTVRLVGDGNNNVINLTNVSVNAAGDSLTASVPKGAPVGNYKARVANNNGTSAAAGAYSVQAAPIPLPVVTNVTPNLAAEGAPVDNVKIIGQNFLGASQVTIDDWTTNTLTVNAGGTEIIVNVPGLAAAEYDVKVTTASGTNEVSAVKYKVTKPVQIVTDTTTSEIVEVSGGDIHSELTLTTDKSETATKNTDDDVEIEVSIPAGTKVTTADGDYTGTINPPRVVKPDTSVHTELPTDALVIEMGNPTQTINFSEQFVAVIKVTATDTPKIYYYNKTSLKYELAGINGEKDGQAYAKGGTILVADGNVYTIGLLLDHMSTYISSVTPLTTDDNGGGTGGGGGMGGPYEVVPPTGTTNIRGKISNLGRFWTDVVARTIDEVCKIHIASGTIGLDANLKPLTEITMFNADAVPPAPDGQKIIGLAYDLGPVGATFQPAVKLTWYLNPADVPAGMNPADFKLAFYDEEAGKWVVLESTYNSVNNMFTAEITHFTTFALIAGEETPVTTPVPTQPVTPKPTDTAVPGPEITTGPETTVPSTPAVPGPETTHTTAPEIPEPDESNWVLIGSLVAAAIVVLAGIGVIWARKRRD